MINIRSLIIVGILCAVVIPGMCISAAACSPKRAESALVELKLAHFMSPKHVQHADVLVPFAAEIEDKTNGRVTITIYPGGALGKPPGQYDAAMTGITDIALGLHGYTPGRFPLVSVMELPFIATSASQGSSILCSLYDQFPEIRDEHTGVKVLWLWTHDAGQLATTKPVHTLEDLKGMKLRCPSSSLAAMIEALGATPVMMPVSELYEALQKGIVDGTLMPISGIYSFNLHEVCQYVTVGDLYVSTLFMVMNLDSWNSLSTKDQKIIEKLTGRHMSEKAAAAYDSGVQLGLDACTEADVDIFTLPPQELARWKELVSYLNEEWIRGIEANGKPGRNIYEETVRLADKTNK